ncbi:hypothetical protein TEK04_17595 [Klenkia sp. LSe6-5]|uniref:Antitoxin of type II TA system, VapB n=1 Tax=Klenkia sesuvii TaxID=3103137 RepID=A0ABU8DXH5_9ACTN
MRTTLTLDDDVAAALAQRLSRRGTKLRQEVNDLLRAGLGAIDAAPPGGDDYQAPTWDSGPPAVPDPSTWSDILDDEDDRRALPPS